jgi:hypothetical protein
MLLHVTVHPVEPFECTVKCDNSEINPSLSLPLQILTPPQQPEVVAPPPQPKVLTPSPQPKVVTPPPQPKVLTPSPQPKVATQPPQQLKVPTPPPQPKVLTPPPQPKVLTQPPQPQVHTSTPFCANGLILDGDKCRFPCSPDIGDAICLDGYTGLQTPYIAGQECPSEMSKKGGICVSKTPLVCAEGYTRNNDMCYKCPQNYIIDVINTDRGRKLVCSDSNHFCPKPYVRKEGKCLLPCPPAETLPSGVICTNAITSLFSKSDGNKCSQGTRIVSELGACATDMTSCPDNYVNNDGMCVEKCPPNYSRRDYNVNGKIFVGCYPNPPVSPP